ncbi:MAG: hypothetical protein IJA30_07520 [Bacilli bacterium]|nr:hypothetical protein [Bacilli bacterium]MBQ3512126.1 hypothetical protein [Bacilli bacterium]
MNQNNNIIGYDSQTGQPIYGNQNTNIQQPTQQPQMNTGYTQQPVQTPPPKKGNKGLVIIALLIVVGIVAAVLYFNNQNKKEPTNNETPNNSEVENNNEQNNEQQNNNSTGSVEEGTNTTYDENGAFLFSIEDVFTITGRGTVVTGNVQRGKLKVGDTVQIVGLSEEILTTEVTGIEMFREQKDEATVGDNAGIVLKDITREQVQRGQVLAKPNSIVAATKFDADVHILSKEEGGRHTPFFDGYRPQFYFRTTDITGVVDLPDNIEMVSPGEDVSFTTTLVSNVAMEVGTEFSIREGGRTIGKGTVTKVY